MGHNFLCYAHRILALSEEAMSITHAGEPAGNFALGSMESTAATRLPTLLAAYHQRFPQVSLSLTTGTSGEIIERVRAGTLAAALVDGPLQHDELNGCIAFPERMVVITCLDHPPIHSAQDVKGETLFAFRASCSYRLRLESWFKRDGSLPGPTMEIQSYHSMLACVASGAGLAMIPYSVLNLLPGYKRVKVHSLPADIAETATWLLWRRDAFGPNVRALKQLIIEQAESSEVDAESILLTE
jgi:DNA-binding transcriptional LysR family regulator